MKKKKKGLPQPWMAVLLELLQLMLNLNVVGVVFIYVRECILELSWRQGARNAVSIAGNGGQPDEAVLRALGDLKSNVCPAGLLDGIYDPASPVGSYRPQNCH